MKRSKFSEEQIVYAIRQAEAGTPVGDLCRHLGVSDATFNTWKKKYAHLVVSELRRLRQLEEENSRLKRLVSTSRSTSTCSRRPCEKWSKAHTLSRTGRLVSRDVSGQLPAGLSPRTVQSGQHLLHRVCFQHRLLPALCDTRAGAYRMHGGLGHASFLIGEGGNFR